VKTGADPKKLALLGGLLLVGGYLAYSNMYSGDSAGPAPAPRAAVPAPINATPERTDPLPDTRRTSRKNVSNRGTEIKPRQGFERPEDRPDPATIDPTLRLDLLAKIQNVEPGAAMRNLFQYGKEAPPPAPAAPVTLPKNPPVIAINKMPPATAPPPPPGPPPPPQAPPITFKYYGYKISKADGRKEAFLLDGDDIIIAGENEAVKRGRYKVVAIGVNSITIEDTQFRSTQTIKLQEETPA
jgi:hypothetical protein